MRRGLRRLQRGPILSCSGAGPNAARSSSSLGAIFTSVQRYAIGCGLDTHRPSQPHRALAAEALLGRAATAGPAMPARLSRRSPAYTATPSRLNASPSSTTIASMSSVPRLRGRRGRSHSPSVVRKRSPKPGRLEDGARSGRHLHRAGTCALAIAIEFVRADEARISHQEECSPGPRGCDSPRHPPACQASRWHASAGRPPCWPSAHCCPPSCARVPRHAPHTLLPSRRHAAHPLAGGSQRAWRFSRPARMTEALTPKSR